MVFLKRHLAHETDYCTLELDEYRTDAGEQMLLAHLRVHQWSLSALRRIQHDWAAFRRSVTTPIFSLPMLAPSDPAFDKWLRFVTMFGWRPTGQQVLCLDGIERPLFIHTI